jgi:hypothetical protein
MRIDVQKIKDCIKSSFTYQNPEFPAGLKLIIQICFIVATTLATMFVAPTVSQNFQKSERKSEFYSSIITELNSNTKQVLGEVSLLSNDKISPQKKEDLYIDVRIGITKLHWRSV